MRRHGSAPPAARLCCPRWPVARRFLDSLCGHATPRVFGGVCSGLALHYGWDITTVRLLWVLCVLFAGTGVLAYIIAWIVIPEAPYVLPESSTGSGV